MKITNLPRAIKIDFDYNRFLKIKAQDSSAPIGDEAKDIAFSKGINFKKKELSSQLNISWESNEILEATFGGVYFTEALDVVFSTEDTDRKLAEIYKEKLDKIDNVISKNPELKNRRKDFIKRLDETLEPLLERKAAIESVGIKGLQRIKKDANSIVSEHFKLDYEEKNTAFSDSESRIKNEVKSIFSKIMKDLKNGVSLEEVKNTSLKDAKYIKSYRDIEAIKKISNESFKMAIDMQIKVWDYHLDHKSNQQTYIDIKNVIKKFDVGVLSKLGTNENLKKVFTSIFNFDDLMHKVENKLLEDQKT